MHRNVFLALIVACSLAAPALAVPTITAGDHVLLPNTAGQQFFLLISPGPPGNANGSGGADGNEQTIAVVDLQLTVGDGTAGPIVTGINLVAPGTIFGAASNIGNFPFPPYNPPGRIVAQSTGTSTGEIQANGNLALITVDTTGIFALPALQTWALSLFNPIEQLPTAVGFGDDPNQVILVTGTLNIAPVPEPTTFVMAGFGMLAFGAVAVRRHRAKQTA